MSNPLPTGDSEIQRKALEAFVAQNPDLTLLEKLLVRFNVFEVMGAVRRELRHSDFLSYLLDPSRNHGLNAIFLKELLQTILLTTETKCDVSLFDLDFWNLSGAEVQREWRSIDILVTDNVNRFAWIVENKIDSTERPHQLARYYDAVANHFPGYKIVAVYLTPDGDVPSHDAYHPVSYLLVCEIIEKIVTDHRSTLGGEVVMALEHYAQMLRRHIVSESEVALLCRRIYQKHRLALDLIYEHKPDLQAEIGMIAKRLVSANPNFQYQSSGKHWFSYHPTEWAENKTLSRNDWNLPYLYLAFDIQPQKLDYLVQMYPAPDTPRNNIDRLYDMARRNNWRGLDRRIRKHVTALYRLPVLSADDYDMDREELTERIEQKWREFVDVHLPKIMEAVDNEAWLWANSKV